MSQQFEFAVELTADEGAPVAFKFSCEYFELNVLVPQAQLRLLHRVPTQTWGSGSICAGSSAGASVFWSAGEPGLVSIMVGPDDQTWNISASIPVSTFLAALSEAECLAAH